MRRERKDVDLVLGQGMLSAGWHAHTLNAPGKFLVSAPEHVTPKRARAYLLTDDEVARVVAHYGPRRPPLDGCNGHVARSVSALPLLNPCRGISSTPTATMFDRHSSRNTKTPKALRKKHPVRASRVRKTFS